MASAMQAQCSFTPTVSGDSILCPNATTTFTTQAYDSYQWYRRVYPDGLPELIAGATQQTLTLTDADLLYFYWVEATDAGCTEASAEVLLDGYVFLLPFVSHTGDFTFDPDLQAFKVCAGDTMFLHFSYGANVTWYKDGEPIPGETGSTLAITETGAYTVEGAPGTCPDFILSLGLVLDVVVVNCTSPVEPGPVLSQINVYPNPAGDWLTVENNAAQPVQQLELVSTTGQLVRSIEPSGDAVQQISLQGLPGGVYFLRMRRADQVMVSKIVKD
jgi:hypothetical protein